jgi:hypothetical protein
VFKSFQVLQRVLFIVHSFKVKFEDLTAFSFDFTGFWSVALFGMESKYFFKFRVSRFRLNFGFLILTIHFHNPNTVNLILKHKLEVALHIYYRPT